MAAETFASTGGGLNLTSELEETEKALREITLMNEQSQGEVTKLSQRNAAITTHLQQMQNQLEVLHGGNTQRAAARRGVLRGPAIGLGMPSVNSRC